MPCVVVVGGGIAGLATATLLARGGARVTLLERHERVGGRAGTLDLDGFRFDTGPSWYFMPEVFEHWFALLGERIEDHLDLVPLDPSYRVFFERPDGAAPARARTVLDVTRDAETNWARFDALSPGTASACARTPRSRARPTAWPWTTSCTRRSSAPTGRSTARCCAGCRGSQPSWGARSRTGSRDACATRACGRSSDTTRSSSVRRPTACPRCTRS
ncbi:FAD-dependent oxidoreductase [Oerskovia sp. M15]